MGGGGGKQVTLAGQGFQGQIIKECTKYCQIEETEFFLNNVLWASLKHK